MSIRVVNIRKTFRRFVALDNVSVNVEPGEFLALLGPSGSGKTTLLRIIAGLETADQGQVYLEGESTSKKAPSERNVGFVFQHYALFRHMTVFENVAFGLRVRPSNARPSRQKINERVMELLKFVHLEGLHGQYPSQLSGGQRQRVALARILAVQPRVMLLDEPFGALDAKVRKELRSWLRRLHDEMHITTIFVTHDQEEALEIADRVAVMNHGKIVQIGSPEEIWNHPKNAFVYDFLGNYNEFLAWKDDAGSIHLCDDAMLLKAEKTVVKIKKELTWTQRLYRNFLRFLGRSVPEEVVIKEEPADPKLKFVKLFIRPFELTLQKANIPGEEGIPARVVHVNPAGPLIKVDLERKSGQLVQAEIPQEKLAQLDVQKNDLLWVYPKSYKIFE